MTEKVKVVIFGGCGFIGRYIVAELLESNIVSCIKVVDKVPPQMAWLNPKHQKYFEDPRVTFKSANLINLASCEAVFEEEYDWVINAAGETKTGQEEAVYKEGILKVSSNCANVAAKRGVKIYLEVSSGKMSSSDKKPFREMDECSPWSVVAKCKYQAEKVIKEIPGLNWIIIRPAITYGPGDRQGLTPRLVVGSIFRYLGTVMKLLWDHNLKMNTVHVKDVARAVVWLCKRGKTGEIYNLVDEGQTTQDNITNIIADIFSIKYVYCGNALSKMAMTEGTSVVQFVNERHLQPWAQMCNAKNLFNTPLTPYIDIDSLHNKHLNLDGMKLINEGFNYTVPKPTLENIMEVLDEFIEMNLLPNDIYSLKEKKVDSSDISE